MSEPDFDGLRTAVEDAAARTPFGSLLARAGARRRRRRAAAGTAALGLVGALAAGTLALPGTADRTVEPGPGPAVTPRPAPSGVGTQVIQTAFGRTTAYALLGRCPGEGPSGCRYELLSSPDAGRTWTRLRAPLPPLPGDGSEGFSAELLVTGADDLTVLDRLRGRAYASTDLGRTFAVRVLRAGPALEAVPPGLQVEATQCGSDGCPGAQLVVFDPDTGRTSPLRAQPVPGVKSLAVATGDDGRIWAVGQDGATALSAISPDRGRTWRTLPPTPSSSGIRLLRIVPLPGRDAGAFLLTGGDEPRNVLNTFSQLWRLDDRDPRWVRVTPPGAPASALTVVGLTPGELLLTAEHGGVWRTAGRGTRIAREPDPQADGAALPLFVLERAGTLLIGRSEVGRPDPYVLVSQDEGRSWDRRDLVAG